MAVENDSYCAETDVVARVGYTGDFTTTTTPTEAELLEFMAQRAAELYSILRLHMGTAATGPAAYSVTVDTSTDAGLALNGVLKQYNAIGAAMDALEAAGAGTDPARTEQIAELFAMWEGRHEALKTAAIAYLGRANRVSTHVSNGEITENTVTSRKADTFAVDGLTKW